MVSRPEQPEPYLRGAAFPPTTSAAYPRALDDARLPRDTWNMARIPAGVRIEFVGDAEAVEIDYRTETDDVGFRGPGGGLGFQLWRGATLVSEVEAVVGEGMAILALDGDTGRSDETKATVHLPEIMRPTVLSLTPRGGSIEPAPPGPRWVAYGDSILEGWSASTPALGWAARVARDHDLDLVNMGYAGSARGELASAEHLVSLDAHVYSITYGTNCWTVVPHSTEMFRAGLAAFLDVMRRERPDTPVVVSSPVLRPDAEDTPNRLGTTLADLRGVMEAVVSERIDAGDARLVLVPGRAIIDHAMLADGIHPNDDGHAAIADAVGSAVAEAAKAS